MVWSSLEIYVIIDILTFIIDAIVDVNKYVRLAPDYQSKQGWLWAKYVSHTILKFLHFWKRKKKRRGHLHFLNNEKSDKHLYIIDDRIVLYIFCFFFFSFFYYESLWLLLHGSLNSSLKCMVPCQTCTEMVLLFGTLKIELS